MAMPDQQQQRRVGLEVNARAVDTYITPAQRQRGGTASALAEALKSLQPSLNRYLSGSAKDDQTAVEARAKLLAAQNPLKELADVQKLEIPAGESPLFRKFYSATKGEEAAVLAETDILTRYRESSANFDPADDAAFDKWLAEDQKAMVGLIEQKNPEFQIQFVDRVTGVYNSLRQQHRKDRHEALLQAELDSFGNTVGAEIEASFAAAAAAKTNPDLDAAWARINAGKDRMAFQQFDKSKIAKTVRDQITAVALNRADEDLLAAFRDKEWTDPVTKKPIPGPFTGAEGRAAYEKALGDIRSARYTMEEREWTKEKRDKEKLEGTVLSQVGAEIYTTGRVSPKLLADLSSAFGPEAANKAVSALSGYRNVTRDVDPAFIAEFYKERSNGDMTPQRFISYHLPRLAADPRMVQIAFDDFRSGRNGEAIRTQSQARDVQVPGYTFWQKQGAAPIKEFGGFLGGFAEAPGPVIARAQAEYLRSFQIVSDGLAAQLDSPDPKVRFAASGELSSQMEKIQRQLASSVQAQIQAGATASTAAPVPVAEDITRTVIKGDDFPED